MDEKDIKQRMAKVVEDVKLDIGGVRTGRATPALVQDIVIPAYAGTQKMRIIELATITVPDPQTIVISPWDKSIIGDIKKGIEMANLGFNPIISGEEIRINLPPLTVEDRENYIRLLHQKLESGRIAIRQVRQEGMREIKRRFEEKEISEDEMIRAEKKLQEMTDEFIKQIDELGNVKESELRSL
jgi:ribosome recycling factor